MILNALQSFLNIYLPVSSLLLHLKRLCAYPEELLFKIRNSIHKIAAILHKESM